MKIFIIEIPLEKVADTMQRFMAAESALDPYNDQSGSVSIRVTTWGKCKVVWQTELTITAKEIIRTMGFKVDIIEP